MSNEAIANLHKTLGYMAQSPDFNESSSALWVYEAIMEIQRLESDLQNWKAFCKKVQSQQLAKPADDQLKAERERAIREIAELFTFNTKARILALLSTDESKELAFNHPDRYFNTDTNEWEVLKK